MYCTLPIQVFVLNITSLYKYRIGGHCEEQFSKNCDVAIFIFLFVMVGMWMKINSG